ncbi:hypothetical protein Acor_50290 [Acrocarpospora corrugata]|uniref:RCC1-like domain-containing protein n=1 Tax=Acrocarpospora corrugata TaxID=35763 RepID=A0A5M3W6Z2_9ACTN|nr:hypothetical protein [Acrocarpospora corrugata]GES02963.1 hypothetical protein Acor_50290 [Acrocarpospora corrugata]
MTNVKAIRASFLSGFAIRTDGTLRAWGVNDNGNLGDGTHTPRWTPIQVPGLTMVTDVSGGHTHTVALRSDGSVWTWGSNGWGQLGDNTQTAHFTPAKVPGISGVKAVAGGWRHSMALRTDGTVWTWGGNANGALGTGDKVDRKAPVPISSLTGISQITAGSDSSYALGSGKVWSWGENAEGQLGDGSGLPNRTFPAKAALPPLVVATGLADLSTSANHMLVIRTVTPGFQVHLTPRSGTMPAGGSLNVTVPIKWINGTPQPVTLTAPGLPPGLTATFNPGTVAPGGSSVMTLTSTPETPPGSYAVTIIGSTTGPDTSTTAVFSLQVTDPVH